MLLLFVVVVVVVVVVVDDVVLCYNYDICFCFCFCFCYYFCVGVVDSGVDCSRGLWIDLQSQKNQNETKIKKWNPNLPLPNLPHSIPTPYPPPKFTPKTSHRDTKYGKIEVFKGWWV